MNCDCSFLTKSRIYSALGVVLGLLIAAWIAVDIDNRSAEGENTITVSASSEVYASPDLALVSLSVVTEKKTVQEAVQKNTVDMNAVIASVKALGVEEKDIKTTNFYISPRYEYDTRKCDVYSSYCPSGERLLVGYDVNQSLQVKIRDLTKIGDIIQGATEAGANQAGDLQFTIENEDALKAQARSAAIEEAKAKAKVLAKELGVRLAKVVSFSESGQYPVYYSSKEAYGLGGGDVAASPTIATGQNQISSTVSLTYKIK
jgi:uncharacterized protein YggE